MATSEDIKMALDNREREVVTHEWRLEVANGLAARPAEPQGKMGRNEPCPCESGLKYKYCHGRAR
jgi:uncharacterized protein YecA (UPF0149 family)